MEEEYQYEIECPMCESMLDLQVYQIDERPCYCPMCGTEVEWSSTE